MKYLTPKGDLDEVAGMRLRKTLLGKNLRDVLLEVGIVNIDSPLGLSINQISIQTNKVSRLAIFLSFFYFTGMPPLFPRPYFTNLLREVPKDILEADEAFQMDLKAIK